LRAGVFTRPRHILIIPRCAGKGRLTTRKPDRAEVKICIAPIEKARQLCGLPTPAQGPDVPTTIPSPNPGQVQPPPDGGGVRRRQLPESVWQVAPMTGVGGS
jgi:hypothetical protein